MNSCLFGQCLTGDFTLNGAACKDKSIGLSALTTSNVSWDFCDGSILNSPTTNTTTLSGAILNPNDISIQNDETGRVRAFVISRGNNNLFRLDFSGPLSTTFTTTNLGNFSGLLSTPQGIQFYFENSAWFALVGNADGSMTLLSFGNSINNMPTGQRLSVDALPESRQIEIVKDEEGIRALIAGGGSSGGITIFDFGNSILNSPVKKIVPVNGVFLTGLHALRQCGDWYILTEGYGSGVHRLQFGSSLLNTPTITDIAGVSNPLNVEVVVSLGNYYAFVPTDGGGLKRLEFGGSLGNSPTVVDLGLLNSGLNIGFDITKQGSTYQCMAVDFVSNNLVLLNFPKSCNLVNDFANNYAPSVTYSSSGLKAISLFLTDSYSNQLCISKNVTVNTPPVFDFTSSNGCPGSPTQFTSINPLNDIATFDWDFNDGANSSSSNPPHTYSSSGNYNVTLTVTGLNGCSDSATKPISIYALPTVDFGLPTSTFCTNQDYTFVNLSNFNQALNPSWEWSVNNVVVSADKNYLANFPSPLNSPQNIKLTLTTTVQSGCAQTITKTISQVIGGPTINFDYQGACQDSPFQFNNLTTDPVLGFTWDFSDGSGTSSAVSTPHSFPSAGFYNVTLSASASNGCLNSKTKLVQVASVPSPDFYIDLPPFSCSGTPTQFHDATPPTADGNIVSWSWDFNDGTGATSTQQNPQHTYSTAGTYQVLLKAKTNFGCEATVQLPAVIAAPPVSDFSSGAVCLNKGTTFKSLNAQAISSWNWTIGSSVYTIAEPTHTFTTSGTYQAMLVAVGANGCEGLTIKNVTVNPVPALDFSTSNLCMDQPTHFTGTVGGLDLPSTWSWIFDGTPGTGSPVDFAFPTAGAKSVKMTVSTQSGCDYSLTKSVIIAPSPDASFTASPAFGAPPLAVQFTSTSQNASLLSWDLGFNGATSTSSNPTFTYTQLGDYLVQLTATNGAGCSDMYSQIINVMVPSYNLAIENLVVQQSNSPNSKIPIVTIKNNSNVSVSSADVWITGSSGFRVKSNVSLSLVSGASQQLTLPLEVFTNEKFLCAEVYATGDVDLSDNQLCENLLTTDVLVAPYPNPTSGILWFEAVLKATGSGTLRIADSMGKTVFTENFHSLSEGMNRVEIDLSNQRPGLYLGIWTLNGKQTEFRFLLQ